MAFLFVTLCLEVMSFDINSLQLLRYSAIRNNTVNSNSQGLHHNNGVESVGARHNMNGEIKELSGVSATSTTSARAVGTRKRKNSPTSTNLNVVKKQNSRESCINAQISISGSGSLLLF